MTNREYMDQAMYLLKQGCIRRAEDLDNRYEGDAVTTSTNIYNDFGKGWITDFYNLTRDHYNSYSALMNEEGGSRACFVSDNMSLETRKYMCIFPSSIILSDSISTGTTEGVASTNYAIPKSFIRDLLTGRDLIENDVFTLLPKSFQLHMSYGAGLQVTALGGVYGPGMEADYLGKNGVFVENKSVDRLLVRFPWLYGANTDDYLNIIEKYAAEYRNYRISMYDFLISCKNGSADFEEKYTNLENAHADMQGQLEKAKSHLKAKGIQAVVGLAFTFIPLLLDIPAEVKASLQAVLGMTSLKDAQAVLFEERLKLKEIGREDPFYITWQWEKKSPIKVLKNKK